jgi:hypothetical protein
MPGQLANLHMLHGPPFTEARALVLLVHPIPQFLSRLEVRNEFAVEADGLTGLGIAADARGAVVQRETAEAADPDPLAGGQGLSHLLKHGLDGQLDILG